MLFWDFGVELCFPTLRPTQDGHHSDLFLCWLSCSGIGGLVVQRVDDLTGAGVVQALASFVLDGIGIILQMIDVVLHPSIFILQLFDLLLQGFVFHALLLVCGNAVLPENNVIAEEDRQQDSGRCSKAPAHAIGKAGSSDQVRVLYGLFHNHQVSGAKAPAIFFQDDR